MYGHALTLSLLGKYLALAHGGDVRQRDKVKLEEANREIKGGHAFQVIAAYERWFESTGEEGVRELETLRLMGFFDRPAESGCLAALRAPPTVAGLNEALVTLSDTQWNLVRKRLVECDLLSQGDDDRTLDAHPLMRDYLAQQLRDRQPHSWREGHRRLYDYLKKSVPHQPEGLAALQPLYQAIVHGCRAGLQQQTFVEVYHDRILRGTGSGGVYSLNQLGAHGDELVAVSCFFDEPWKRVSTMMSEDYQSWLLGQAAMLLRGLGRLAEAVGPMRASLQGSVAQEDWKNAAIAVHNLIGLELSMGRVSDACQDALTSVEFAERSRDPFQREVSRAVLANVLHQQGHPIEALELFREAEVMQGQRSPARPLLYSMQGFCYCDLLLAEVERAVWQTHAYLDPIALHAEFIQHCSDIENRVMQTMKSVPKSASPRDIALDHLTRSRCKLYIGLLRREPSSGTALLIRQAVDGLRKAGVQEYVCYALLTRAWVHFASGDLASAQADLDEGWQIATRGDMRLLMADIHLHRARLFHDRSELGKARTLIERCAYGRRIPELGDAEAAASTWARPISPTQQTDHKFTQPSPEVIQVQDRPVALPPLTPLSQSNAASEMRLTPQAPIDFIIITPLAEERDAILARLPGHRQLPPSAHDIRVYYASRIPVTFSDGSESEFSVIVAPLAGLGHTEAATATSDSIRRWRPRYVLLVGIAGGIAKAGVSLGDVLISDQVADYELQKVTTEGLQIRWQVHRVDQRLLNASRNFAGSYATLAPRPAAGQPTVHWGPICTGNKVVADESLAAQLREVWMKLIGVEMEAGGVANAAAQSASQPGFFMIRGVSDLADVDKDSDAVKLWRPYAREIAAAWTVEFLKHGPVPPADSNSRTEGTGTVAGQSSTTALTIWRERLDFLQQQEAIASDSAQKFTLKKQIEEAQAKIRELGGGSA